MKTKYLILILAILFRYFQFYNIVADNSLLCYIFVFIILLLALLEIFKLKFNKKMFLITIFLLILSLILFFLDTDDNLFIYTLIALVFLDTDDKKLLKTFFITSLIMYLTTIVLNHFGIITSNDSLRDGDIASSIRYSLGFGHVNSVFLYYLPIVYSGYYLYNDKKIFKWLVLISSIILFNLSNCRTGFIFTLLFLIFTLLKDTAFLTFLKKLIKYLFPILTISSFILIFLYGTTKHNVLNELLSYRLSNAYYYIDRGYLFTFFGSNIDKTCALDIFYINLLVRLGIYGYLVYFYIFFKGASLIKDKKMIIIASLYLLYGLSEAATTGNFILIIFIKEILLKARSEEKYEKN